MTETRRGGWATLGAVRWRHEEVMLKARLPDQLVSLLLIASSACSSDDPASGGADATGGDPAGMAEGDSRSASAGAAGVGAATTAGGAAGSSAGAVSADAGGLAEVGAAASDDGEVFLAPLGPPPRTDFLTVSVSRLGAGLGRVTSSPPGIDCGPQCSAAFPGGTNVVLRGRPENGSDSLLTGWSIPYCERNRDCAPPPLTIDETLEVSFEPMTANVAFLNAELVPTNLGSARAYDAVCNATATRAGLNNLAGDRFVAVVSDAADSFRTRLGASASGWMLLDGRPFAGSATELFDEQRVYNPLNVDDTGTELTYGPAVMTNSLANGTSITVADNCSDLTSLTGTFGGGTVSGGPRAWIETSVWSCGRDTATIYCLGRDFSAVVTPRAVQGLRVWLSNEPYHPGQGTPDDSCRALLPPGAADARALIATTSSPASAVLILDQVYVRPDGVRVGTGSDIANNAFLSSGIWQKANGDYLPAMDRYDDSSLPSRTWTGEIQPTVPGTVESTCNDWTSSVGNAFTGDHADKIGFWSDGTTRACDWTGGGYLYCVEVAAPP